MLENMPQSKVYRENILQDLTSGIQKINDGKDLSKGESIVISNVLAIAMNRLGVK